MTTIPIRCLTASDVRMLGNNIVPIRRRGMTARQLAARAAADELSAVNRSLEIHDEQIEGFGEDDFCCAAVM